MIVPGKAGELCILARHAPLLGKLRPELVRLADQFGKPQELFISSGYLEVQRDTVTILADTILRTPEMDEASARGDRMHPHRARRTSVRGRLRPAQGRT